jgi:hypothetical protein
VKQNFQLAPRHALELELWKKTMLEQWSNFFVMVGGGAAALAGLIS